ncbi:methylenetetrahydrofolate reductase [Pseudonocardia acaciae]|uniref:methylenetetrahydrofolate reductase n=1 Tax=Pseudonocardia acaciae TaxID=551276 RepID=UPI000A07916B|nr:methylenetetrahydrofolate reductase [Pseudonocardia acaciae]
MLTHPPAATGGVAGGGRELPIVARLLAGARFELTPLSGALEQAEALPAGATVTVTTSPSRGVGPTVALAERLAERGFHAVPHLPARQILDTAELSELLGRLDRAGVREVFVVGGDADPPRGEFADGLSLLRAMRRIGHRPARIGVPCYPEGHPLIDDGTLWSALLAKQELADYATTQMCFDPAAVCRFARAARERGVTLPILVGVPGVVNLRRLLRISMRIGVGDSVRFVRGQRTAARELLRPGSYRPDALVHALAAEEACAFAGLHFYMFNDVEATMRWLREVSPRASR